jgi:hypothetical protein
METVVFYVEEFGFPVVAMVGLGYFVYYVWNTMTNVIGPAIKEMHFALIKLIDQIRMLDNDMIRLQQKVNTVLQMKENEKKRNNTSSTSNDSKRNGTST